MFYVKLYVLSLVDELKWVLDKLYYANCISVSINTVPYNPLVRLENNIERRILMAGTIGLWLEMEYI